MTDPAAQMREAAEALRTHQHAVPGFSEPVARLLDLTADAGTNVSRERRDVVLSIAQEVLGPVTNRTEEGNEQ
jgi:hypothetical protein